MEVVVGGNVVVTTGSVVVVLAADVEVEALSGDGSATESAVQAATEKTTNIRTTAIRTGDEVKRPID